MHGKMHLFHNGIDPNEIVQGSLANCYFLSTMSVMAENSHRIIQTFMQNEAKNWGIVGVNMTKNGRKMRVILDDYIPCTTKNHIAYA